MSKPFYVQDSPFEVPTTDGKLIEEHFGLTSDGNADISIAHMIAPPHWSEPPQRPEFDEYTYIIKGKKKIIVEGESVVVSAGQSIKVSRGHTVQYSNPFDEPCEYIAICRPAFSIDTVHRELDTGDDPT